MSADSHAERFERVTVYVDIAAAANTPEEGRGDVEEAAVLLELIQASAAAVTGQLVVVDSRSLVSAEEQARPSLSPEAATGTASEATSLSMSTTLQLLRYWQAEEADVYTRDVNNTVPFMRAWECLITSKNTRDGAVTYALHRRQMPVLSLALAQAGASTRTPKSAVEELLYTCVPSGATQEEKRDAVVRFFTFPPELGAYVVAPSVSAAGEAKPPRYSEAGPASASTAAAAAAATAAAVVVVNKDGYPVHLPWTPSLLPPPPVRFAGVLREWCLADSAQMEMLRRRNPLLPGALAAFHRYENRGLLRSALQRGYRVEVAEVAESDEDAASAEDRVHRFADLSITNNAEADSQRKQAAAAATLRNFESTWLDLPLPQAQP
ncbi:conserved hypothetical protein [Leishmania major strain Friedlin]|uniref:Uncharacterized protein n=1 Tax=Leishmania major TaxID=5664 RepID=E9ADX9_LEIMA|nr:conserved hypothetical protein [Leishmania major strain Friedlin]CAG9577858.1 hypothetical_protein_-_conserved [Leishmania major strain Friedlin]CBZ12458.1 conserved hypothetical protein [Leishmania major strain Friedlin]|eukprot:XP_003722200.1 conserved hypothetical protein [Leishmania major strain Friedlin]